MLVVPSQVSHHPLVLHTVPRPMCLVASLLWGSQPASSPALAGAPLRQGCACPPGPPQLSVLPRCCVRGPPGAGVADLGVGPDRCPLAVLGSGAGEPRGGVRPPRGLLPEALHPHLQALCPAAQPGPCLQQQHRPAGCQGLEAAGRPGDHTSRDECRIHLSHFRWAPARGPGLSAPCLYLPRPHLSAGTASYSVQAGLQSPYPPSFPTPSVPVPMAAYLAPTPSRTVHPPWSLCLSRKVWLSPGRLSRGACPVSTSVSNIVCPFPVPWLRTVSPLSRARCPLQFSKTPPHVMSVLSSVLLGS